MADMKNPNIWKDVLKKYPDIQAVLDDIHRTQLVLWDKIDNLQEHYPVEGYEWEDNPNADISSNSWGLVSTQWRKECEQRCDESLAKQRVCVEGRHHFKHIGHFKWCEYCGTVVVGDKIFYPEQPHFLPKEV